MTRILIIEDDPAILEGLVMSLEAVHYTVITASDGAIGYEKALEEEVDFIILDLMLPNKNGEDICRDLRAQGCTSPILMLTSKHEEIDKVMGLEAGADDYLTKPFSVRELQARIKAILRRQTLAPAPEEDSYAFDNITVDFRKQTVTKQGQTLTLSAREFEILKYFIQHKGEVVTRDMLLNAVWGYDVYPTTRTVDNYILALRKHLEENPSKPRYLRTVHTSGYRFIPPE